MNIVNEVFKEMEVNDIIEEIGGESSDKDQPIWWQWLHQWL